MPVVSRAQYRFFEENKEKLLKQGVKVGEFIDNVKYHELPERKGQPNRQRYSPNAIEKMFSNLNKKYSK